MYTASVLGVSAKHHRSNRERSDEVVTTRYSYLKASRSKLRWRPQLKNERQHGRSSQACLEGCLCCSIGPRLTVQVVSSRIHAASHVFDMLIWSLKPKLTAEPDSLTWHCQLLKHDWTQREPVRGVKSEECGWSLPVDAAACEPDLAEGKSECTRLRA